MAIYAFTYEDGNHEGSGFVKASTPADARRKVVLGVGSSRKVRTEVWAKEDWPWWAERDWKEMSSPERSKAFFIYQDGTM